MHKLLNLMGIISIVLLSCSLICGIWVCSHPVEDMAFHAGLCGGAAAFALVTQILFLNKCRFCKNK